MGCFNFECKECGEGISYDRDTGEEGERRYFNAACSISVPSKRGGEVIIKGTYSGYGEVILNDGTLFYPIQFQEYWDGWLESSSKTSLNPYIAGDMYCKACMSDYDVTDSSKWSYDDFERVRKEAVTAPKVKEAIYLGEEPSDDEDEDDEDEEDDDDDDEDETPKKTLTVAKLIEELHTLVKRVPKAKNAKIYYKGDGLHFESLEYVSYNEKILGSPSTKYSDSTSYMSRSHRKVKKYVLLE